VSIADLNTAYFIHRKRAKMPRIDDARQSFDEVNTGLSEVKLREELDRCFSCGVCNSCDNCWVFCPDVAIKRENGVYSINYDYCKGCLICVEECRAPLSPPRRKGNEKGSRRQPCRFLRRQGRQRAGHRSLSDHAADADRRELSEMCASGELNAKFIKVESEHSAMAAVVGSSAAGARFVTATSSQGLLLMHEMLHWAVGARLPIVVAKRQPFRRAAVEHLDRPERFALPARYRHDAVLLREHQEVHDTMLHAFQSERGSDASIHGDTRLRSSSLIRARSSTSSLPKTEPGTCRPIGRISI